MSDYLVLINDIYNEITVNHTKESLVSDSFFVKDKEEIFFKIGVICFVRGQYKESLDNLITCLDMKDRKLLVCIMLGHTCELLRNYEQALTYLNLAILYSNGEVFVDQLRNKMFELTKFTKSL